MKKQHYKRLNDKSFLENKSQKCKNLLEKATEYSSSDPLLEEGRYLRLNSTCSKCKAIYDYVYNLQKDDNRCCFATIPWYCVKCHPAYQK